MLKMFGFRYWIVGAAIVVVAIFFMADKQHDAAKKYKSHRAEYCAALMATAEQKKACVEEGTSVKDYLPWRYILFIWPEGITTWAIIATGFVIAWQSSETRRAADAALGSAKAANDQIRMMKDKERARLSVKPIDKSTFTYDFLGENTVWLDIENFGTTHALNVRATCDAVPIANGIIPENVERGYLLVPDTIRANAGPEQAVTMFFLGADEITRLNQESLDLAIRVIGSIEYDDLFGDHHVTPFQYSLKAVRFGEIDYLKNTIATTYAIEWQKTGPPEANRAI